MLKFFVSIVLFSYMYAQEMPLINIYDSLKIPSPMKIDNQVELKLFSNRELLGFHNARQIFVDKYEDTSIMYIKKNGKDEIKIMNTTFDILRNLDGHTLKMYKAKLDGLPHFFLFGTPESASGGLVHRIEIYIFKIYRNRVNKQFNTYSYFGTIDNIRIDHQYSKKLHLLVIEPIRVERSPEGEFQVNMITIDQNMNSEKMKAVARIRYNLNDNFYLIKKF